MKFPILHIVIIFDTKFEFKQAILNFGLRFQEKDFFQPKAERVNTTIEYCIFELA